MAARPQLPGMRWFLWLRNAALRIGVLTGIYLSCVFVAWLLVANHIPQLEPFAGVRNLVAGAVMILLLAIPVLRFRNEPAKMFVSGLTAWTLLTLTYFAAEMHFSLLESRMGALQVFMLGAVSYGFVAVFSWVFLMCAEARHRHIAQAQHAAALRQQGPHALISPHPTKRKKDSMKLCRFQPQIVPPEKAGRAGASGSFAGRHFRRDRARSLRRYPGKVDRHRPLLAAQRREAVAAGRIRAKLSASAGIIWTTPPNSIIPARRSP